MTFVQFRSPGEAARQQIGEFTAAARDRLAREDTVELLTDLLRDYVRDGVGVATLRIEGLTRAEFDEVEARRVNGWRKREEIRCDGKLVAAIEFETDQAFAR